MARLDFQGDTGHRTLHKIGKLYSLPSYVIDASLEDLATPSKKASLYADVRLPYQFPCHTKAATVLSAAYFFENQHSIPEKVRPAILDHLNKFAGYFGVAGDLQALMEKNAEINRDTNYPDSDYAIVKVSSAGTKQRLYPMRNWMETKAAADWYLEHLPELRLEYGFRDRQLIAEKIIDKTSDYNMTLPRDTQDKLERYAGVGTGSPKKVAQHIRNRTRFSKDAGVRERMLKLAQIIENKPQAFFNPDTLADLADTVDKFDRQAGILNKYAETVPAPEDFIFEATLTKIAEFQDTTFMTMTGSAYTREQLSKLSSHKIRSLLGDEIADAVSTGMKLDPVKLAEVAITLPRGDAELFDELMKSVGEAPLHKSSVHIGLSPEVLGQIAAAN